MTEAQLSSQVRRVILAQESTYGTDEIDLANNLAVARTWQAFDSFEPTFNKPPQPREIIRPSFGRPPHINVRRNTTVNAAGEVTAASDPGQTGGESPYGLQDILIANGMSSTVVSQTTDTYVPSTKATAGLTAYIYARELTDENVGGSDNWRMTYLTGLKGTGIQISGAAGEILRWTSTLESNNLPFDESATTPVRGWTESDAFFDTSDGTIAKDKTGTGITYTGTETTPTPNPMYLEAATVKLGASNTTFDCSAFSVAINNTVKLLTPTRADPTVDAVVITAREIAYEFTLAGAGAAYNQFLGDIYNNSTFDVEIIATDRQGSGGSTLTITTSLAQFDEETFTEDTGLAAWTIPAFGLCDYSSNAVGDNDLSMVWSVT